MNLKKKGLEPLIATILLIVVAVILVTIVLAWGKNFTTEGLGQTNDVINNDCMGATISVSNCTVSGTTATFLIKNTSDKFDFPKEFIVTGFVGNSTTSVDVNISDLGPGATKSKTATLATGTEKIEVRSAACPTVAVASVNCN